MYKQLIDQLSISNTQLIAVSKTKPNAAIMDLYEQGQRDFGENKVQELVQKQAELPKDIRWHFIGHLQRNKVKYLAEFVDLIHGVDSLRLLKEINKQAAKHNRVIKCLLQFHIAKESTKFGLNWEEAKTLLSDPDYLALENIQIVGVMGMATFTAKQEVVRAEFKDLKILSNQLKEQYFAEDDSFQEISMGMSGDYHIAIEEGSTMVRIGTLLFGNRNYT